MPDETHAIVVRKETHDDTHAGQLSEDEIEKEITKAIAARKKNNAAERERKTKEKQNECEPKVEEQNECEPKVRKQNEQNECELPVKKQPKLKECDFDRQKMLKMKPNGCPRCRWKPGCCPSCYNERQKKMIAK